MSDKFLVHALEVVNDWLLVLEGRTVTYVNQEVLDALERPREEVVSKDLAQIIPGFMYDEIDDLLSEVEEREGKVRERDIKAQDPALGSRGVHIRGLRKAGYTYLSIQHLYKEEMSEDDRLMELEDRLSAFLSLTTSAGIGLGVFEIVDDGIRIRSINEHGAALFGRTEREMLNQNPLQFVAPEDQERARMSLKALVEEGSTDPLIIKVLDSDGEMVHLRITQTMLASPSGNLGIGFIQDETPIRDALDQANQMVQAIERVQETVVLGDQFGRIIYANPAALRNSGYSFEEVVGKPISIFSSPEGLETAQTSAMAEMMMRGWFRGDVMACTKDGKRYPVDVSASLVRNGEGKVSMIVIVSRKVEERQRFEAQLMMAKHSTDYVRDVIEHQILPELEGSVKTLEALGEAGQTVQPEHLGEIVRDLRLTIEGARGTFESIQSRQSVEELEPIDLANILSERLPRILERLKVRGRSLEVDLDVRDGDATVMANWMLPELITRLLVTIDSLATPPQSRYEVTLDSIPMIDRSDIVIEGECDAETPCFAILSISGAINDEVSFAVETSRLLVFLYKGQILIDDADPKDPEGGVKVSVILPLAGSQPPSHIRPPKEVDFRDR